MDVLVYSNPDDPMKKNRGFAFLDYDTHKNAAGAKRRMESGSVAAWGRQFVVSWAEPQEEPDAETMSKVCFLHAKYNSIAQDNLGNRHILWGFSQGHMKSLMLKPCTYKCCK